MPAGTDTYESRFVTARDGLRLHVRDYVPEAPARSLPVVCLPGLARTAADFHALALDLVADEKRPRRVLAVDYRGRGASERDRDWRNYDVRVELDDLMQALAALGVERAIFIGTSRGGLITMALSAARPAAIAAAVLNDIGPIIEARGLMRIRGYVGKLPSPRTIEEAVDILRRLQDAQFPALSDAEWREMAATTWRQDADGHLLPDYDPALLKTLEMLDLESKLPELWPLFGGLADVPVLALRGANSDILSPDTLARMRAAHERLEAVETPAQGHAPLTSHKDVRRPILSFIRHLG
ncbi:alpha/beta fold hydrolase [Chelatococcus sp. GW1]|uniref:alpha/beta fold hydrolase n=1 Tax=Chelatococcus sp. GW1 TaxID=1211115 RepID=UPI00035C1FDE|nr:alpha/beta fold hydrolase [Chelatococcus sp. GW1]